MTLTRRQAPQRLFLVHPHHHRRFSNCFTPANYDPTKTPTMASAADYVKLASTLPPMLHRFFARFPPGSNAANIFRHTKNETTGRWHNPKYSLRRQKELVKLSQDYGVEELLPPTVKSSVARAERAALGPRLRRMMTPKGKGWERSLRSKYVYCRSRWVRRVSMSANGIRWGRVDWRCGQRRWRGCRLLSRSGGSWDTGGGGRIGRSRYGGFRRERGN